MLWYIKSDSVVKKNNNKQKNPLEFTHQKNLSLHCGIVLIPIWLKLKPIYETRSRGLLFYSDIS